MAKQDVRREAKRMLVHFVVGRESTVCGAGQGARRGGAFVTTDAARVTCPRCQPTANRSTGR